LVDGITHLSLLSSSFLFVIPSLLSITANNAHRISPYFWL
jgi:hypothetical protein